MLSLSEITKTYQTANFKQYALKDVKLVFRDNEFVSILGPSGSGKTTLLNIIGGLDTATSGSIEIDGQSVDHFTDKDWDAYRNHKVGFIFQSYNLISHQSIVENVELALTLSGVSKEGRRERAIKALEDVGLGDHINKRPAQLSGGQMQRVAIARALINDPEILLADEPTGALDEQTSEQIMNLLEDIAQDRLVIMVTHNPEIAEHYSDRIIRLRDGTIISDSNPYDPSLENNKAKLQLKRTRMSFLTALQLSFRNLMSKKGRTILTGFAGSIGIIGIALILSLTTGVQDYIDQVQEDILVAYPLQINDTTFDLSSLTEQRDEKENEKDPDLIYGDGSLSVSSNMETLTNNLTNFKAYIDDNDALFQTHTNAIHYQYPLDLKIYRQSDDNILQVNPSLVPDKLGMGEAQKRFVDMDAFSQLIEQSDFLTNHYELLGGRMPENYNELLLQVNARGEIEDSVLYSIGLRDQAELDSDSNESANISQYTVEDLLNLSFTILPNHLFFEKVDDVWLDRSDDDDYIEEIIDQGEPLQVVGVIQADTETERAGLLYSQDLIEFIAQQNENSEIAKQQLENPDINVFTGRGFGEEIEPAEVPSENESTEVPTQNPQTELSPEQQEALIAQYTLQDMTYEDALTKIGVVDEEKPDSIHFYAKNFEEKNALKDAIQDYNNQANEEDTIEYTDEVALIMDSVTSIISMITYVLIGFVAISLIVSSIMIGIITYISVIERTKEIGILRSVGASKGDIARVFNAETIIEGLLSGIIGIGAAWLIGQGIDLIVYRLTGIESITILTPLTAISLILLSIILTFIAGLIPSRMAANQNPIEALRSE